MMAQAAAQNLQGAGAGGLRLALERLAAAPETFREQAAAAASGQASLPAVLLREIGETVLPRELTVVCGQETAAVLVAAQRRLAAVHMGTAPERGAGPDDPAAAARIFAGQLRALEEAAGGRGFAIRRRPCQAPDGAGSCPVEQLRKALEAPSRGGTLAAFRELAEAKAEAMVLCRGDEAPAESWGPEALLGRLQAACKAAAGRAGGGTAARLPEPKPECMLLPVSPQQSILAASAGGETLLLALSAEAATAVLEDWNSVFAAP